LPVLGSFGLPEPKYQRTCVLLSAPTAGLPSSSVTKAVSVTFPPTSTSAASGSTFTRVPGAAIDGVATLSRKDAASASDDAAATIRRRPLRAGTDGWQISVSSPHSAWPECSIRSSISAFGLCV
jgi:hypothetical protein